MRFLLLVFFIVVFSFYGKGQNKTYCNPLNLDYGYTPFETFSQQGRHRTTADPVIVNFKGKYYLFSTNQEGYWWSENFSEWHFIHRKFLLPTHQVIHDLNAPAAWSMQGFLYVYGSTHDNDFPIWRSANPDKNEWEIAADSFQTGAWDPAFFYDDSLAQLLLFWGSSNAFPIMGTSVDPQTFKPSANVKPIVGLNSYAHGWERFGEHNDNTFLPPFIEGAWLNKYHDKYYLQYSAPGTEFSGYADGVYVSKDPFDGYQYQQHNPFSYKPGGFARGAGHGATFQDFYGNYWHVSTLVIGVKNNFERRIGLWPAGFDEDDVLYCNTAYGDYPTYLPTKTQNHLQSQFAGWMLLNYQKPVKASSTLGALMPAWAVDEDIKTFWSATSGNQGEWFESDLMYTSEVFAIQINYADQDAEFLGKTLDKAHKYIIYSSLDEKKWIKVIDKSQNTFDVPHDYIAFEKPIKARYIKIVNHAMPTGKFALSGFRIFGKSPIAVPKKVENFVALRAEKDKNADRRNVWLKWQLNPDADGYVIYFGTDPEKLYGSIMVNGANEYYFSGLDLNATYYFQIEAFNAAGISLRTSIIKAE